MQDYLYNFPKSKCFWLYLCEDVYQIWDVFPLIWKIRRKRLMLSQLVVRSSTFTISNKTLEVSVQRYLYNFPKSKGFSIIFVWRCIPKLRCLPFNLNHAGKPPRFCLANKMSNFLHQAGIKGQNFCYLTIDKIFFIAKLFSTLKHTTQKFMRTVHVKSSCI